MDRKVIVMGLHKSNLYEMSFTKVHGTDVVNLTQSLKKDGACELRHHWLGHLDVKSVYALKSLVNDMNLGKIPCPTSSLICETCIAAK